MSLLLLAQIKNDKIDATGQQVHIAMLVDVYDNFHLSQVPVILDELLENLFKF
jgi:hypothetical protein